MKNRKFSKGRTLAAILLFCLMGLIFLFGLLLWYHGERRFGRPGAAILGSTVCGLVLFVYLMRAAGHGEGSEEVKPGVLEKIPYDVFAVVTFLCVCLVPALASSVSIRHINLFDMLFLTGIAFAGSLVLILFCMSNAVRIKTHTFWDNWLLLKIIRSLSAPLRKAGKALLKGLRELPLFRRDLLIAAGLCLLEWLLISMTPSYDSSLGFLLFVKDAVLLSAAAWLLLGVQNLREGTKALAAGDLNRKISTDHLVWELREHAEDLNRISDGMSAAVEERLKSERLRTELITNVSHDIKTPLTSIINYVGLLEKADPGDEKTIREYLDVLSRQSVKLKKLIEDLIEASKAATGNLPVHPEACDLTVLLQQAVGEYTERMENAGLKPVVSCPEEPVVIMADGRHLWRVLDNLMNNICKYAQEGTRVYISLEKEGGNALLTFRNISREELNISAEELTERFTRGDSSRSTEGNGLGLAIADSLTKLQGGQMNLTLDGDLFKVQLSFPLTAEECGTPN